MTPERWKQVEEIFNEAIELDDRERPAFLYKNCGGDENLREEVGRLLAQYDEASSFFEQPVYDSARSGFLSGLLEDGDDDRMAGKVLGSYRVEREIGRGGMGAVYEASRADGEFRLKVAIKVVKRGIDTDFVLRRFRNERQILATLDHPFITRLIDGGSTEDGRPYFVMEHIDGLPLYRYADKLRLTISERLELFCRVCKAVEYAHQKLVIHRDIKPSNIFVTEDGSPRLLDFGIAKLLDPGMASDTLHPTETSLRMMTVDYASPEQVRGEKVTYSTDIYSLGVVLFELLTGHRPYKLKGRSQHEVARAICDDDPPLPSESLTGDAVPAVRVNPTATTLPGLGDAPRETAEALSEELRGDLDNITLRALMKEPDERYPSVTAFREDIEKHLAGEQVSASPAFAGRRSQKEQKTDSESGTIAVLPLSVLSPAAPGNMDESYLRVGLADAIITRLTRVRQLTVRPTSSVTRYDQPLVNPLRAGLELGVDFVLDGRMRRFGERIRISLQLLDVHKGSALWAGQFDGLLTDVLDLEDAISEQVAEALIPQLTGEDKEKLAKRGTNDPQANEAYIKGRFYWNQFTTSSLPKALAAFEKAIEIDPDFALAWVGIANFYMWANIYGLVEGRNSYSKSEAAARRALQIDPQLGEAYASMGLNYANKYDFELAEKYYLRAIELSPQYPMVYERYAALLIGTGRPEEGIKAIDTAEEFDPLSLRLKILGAWAYYQVRNYEKAREKAEAVIELDRSYPQGHLQRGNTLIGLHRADEAVEEVRQASELMPGSGLTEYLLCFAYAAAGRLKDAAELAEAMEERSRREYVKPMFLALGNAAAGRLDTAFEYFDLAVDEFDPWLVWIATDSKLDAIRDDPRFSKLLERTGRHVVDGKLAVIDYPSESSTSLKLSEAATAPLADAQTGRYQGGLLRRHSVAISIAAVLLLIMGVGFKTGIITASITRADDPATAVFKPKKLIAVMPFTNATGDAANDYLSDGIGDDLTDRLSNLPNSHVISRSALVGFKGKNVQPTKAGADLGADSVLVGSVKKQGEDILLSAELINVADGKLLYSFNFQDSADKVAALQNLFVSKVAEKLGGDTITGQRRYTENSEAFQLYLKGEYSRQRASPAGISDGIEFYENALKLDPDYALAYQGLSLAYRSAPAYGVMPPHDAYPKAKAAAQKALDLDPSLVTVYVTLAAIRATYDWDFAGAETQYKQAINFGVNNSEAHYAYGNFLVAMGRYDEALTELGFAQQIDPLSLNIQTNIAWALYIAGRYDEAIAQDKRVIDRDPTFARAYFNLGETLLEKGNLDEAIAMFQKSKSLSDDPLTDMAIGHGYAVAGRKAEATKIAVELEDKVRRNEVSPFLPAVVYAGLNEKDKSFYWLERAYQDRSNWLTLIKVGRRMKNLRGDPRFDDLLKRIGFTS